jgi:hypothetical protein
VFKKIALSLVFGTAALFFGPLAAKAELGAVYLGRQTAETPPVFAADDPRLVLMVRSAIIALNQANLTGNYSVLRDLGTPNFQLTNSSARLAEAFASLRTRKLDISPIMFFNPKFVSQPGIQEGQILRLTGVFPTTPEQVNFDIAFQLNGEQWMLAAIAVSVTPPGDGSQVFAAPSPAPGRAAETAEKPIRIDLSQPATPVASPAPAKPAAVKKPAAKKPKPAASQTAAAQQPAPASPAPAEQPGARPSQGEAEQGAPDGQRSGIGANWNLLGR